MKTLIKSLVISIGIAAASSLAMAAGPTFSQADANADGRVSMEEAKAALPDVDEAKIAAADTNGDGSLQEDEYAMLSAG